MAYSTATSEKLMREIVLDTETTGLDPSEEISQKPRDWNDVYLALLARGLVGADETMVDDLALVPLASLPDEAFFDAVDTVQGCTRIAADASKPDDLTRLHRWASEVRGRGACKHPDGAAIFLSSALQVFAREFANHAPHDMRQTA